MHVRLLLKQQGASAPSSTSLLHQLPLGNTLSSGQGQARITCIPSVCPHNDGNVLAPAALHRLFFRRWLLHELCCSRPTLSLVCAPLHRKADFSPNLAVTEPLPWVGAQLTGTHTEEPLPWGTALCLAHTALQPAAKALPCHSWLCCQLHREAVSGFKWVP